MLLPVSSLAALPRPRRLADNRQRHAKEKCYQGGAAPRFTPRNGARSSIRPIGLEVTDGLIHSKIDAACRSALAASMAMCPVRCLRRIAIYPLHVTSGEI